MRKAYFGGNANVRYFSICLLAILQGCATMNAAADKVTFSCIRGVAFVHSKGGGLAWLPDLKGRPVSCIDFGGAEFTVPEDVPDDAK